MRLSRILLVVLFVGLGLTACTPDNNKPDSPDQVIDLTRWKLSLPIAGNDGQPQTIGPAGLGSYNSSYLELNSDRSGVTFRTNVGGAIQEDSKFPRTELREMSGPDTEAAWSNDTGTHVMTITEAITQLPPKHPSIVAGQVHSQDEYIVLIRLDGRKLYVKSAGTNKGTLDDNYQLGAKFTVKIEAKDGHIRVFYNDTPKVDLTRNCTGCYFKAGAYLQTNPDYGDDKRSWGEVQIYRLDVTHQ